MRILGAGGTVWHLPYKNDDVKMILNILAIIIAVALIILILLQMQGSGLSSAFGGGGEFYRSRQSIEKILVVATVVFSLLFGILSVVLLIPR